MASSSAATQKAATIPSIVFKWPDLKADVRLQVFKQEFHCHSVALRHSSAYFRKFLDSPEKVHLPQSHDFKYDYVSVVGSDGQWGLEPKNMVDSSAPNHSLNLETGGPVTIPWPKEYKDQESGEEAAFRNLLCAMYNRPYKMISYYDLRSMVRLADFYCALPILSSSLEQAFLASPAVAINLHHNAFWLLPLMKKLRNATLFRECMVYVTTSSDKALANKWYYDEPELLYLVMVSRNRLLERLAAANVEVLDIITRNKEVRRIASGIQVTTAMNAANYYRAVIVGLSNHYSWVDPPLSSKYLLELLENRLVLGRGADVTKAPWKDLFLCTEITDEELLWDLEETDW